MLRMDHSDSHPLHQRRKKRKWPERDTALQLFTNISHFTPLSFSLPKCTHTQTRLNPENFRGDQQWHKTGSERKEDSVITKAADLAHHSLFQSCHLLPQTSLNHNLNNNICHLQQTQSRCNSNQCDITEQILYGFLLLVSVPGVQ